MSRASDAHELDVANYINSLPSVSATRPKVNTTYSDVVVDYRGKTSWLEVKMNHTDNLGNPRVRFDGDSWVAGVDGPINRFSLDLLNSHPQAKAFLDDLRNFVGRDRVVLMGGDKLKDPDEVPLSEMKKFFTNRNRYIIVIEDADLGELATNHYLYGKSEPAHYMQAGDDLYMIGDSNPLGLTQTLPRLAGLGTFRMRVSTRSKFYEIMPEIKIRSMPESPYSLHPKTTKPHPFVY